jgi:glutamyl-tRNA reductase
MNSENLILVGVNHLSVPVACRERMAVPTNEVPETLRHLAGLAGLEEAALVSTCSRVEVMGAALDPEAAAKQVRGWFIRRGGPEIEPALSIKRGDEALRHLFRVAAGLDSWIIGESEILGQVKRAYQTALQLRSTGRILNQAFQGALWAGKSVRAQTGIQGGIHSIGGAAASLAKRIFCEDQRGQVVVFGAGEAAEAVLRHLAAKNFKEIWVANRTLERAQALARPLGGKAVGFDEGLRRLSTAEAGVFSAACPKVLLEAATLRPLLGGRRRPLFLIDLGLPRNIDPECAKLVGVYLYDLDDLRQIVQESMGRKKAEKEKAEILTALAASECLGKLKSSEARRLDALQAGRSL